MSVHRFSLQVEGLELDDSQFEALYEAGCDDATFGRVAGRVVVTFNREAESFAVALATAVAAIEETVPGARVTGLEREGELAAS